jgi:ADP-ribose pyrophosphatase YjhB (NUDIX family)
MHVTSPPMPDDPAPPFRFCYHCGSAALEIVSWRQVKCTQCSFRQYVTPTPAAVAVVVDAHDLLLLMRRAHEPGLGKLGLPGGIIEPWQSAEEACSREVEEETGVIVPSAKWTYLGNWNNRYRYQDYTWPTLDIGYAARVTDFSEARAVDGEASEIVAMPLHEVVLEELAFPTHADAIKAFIAMKAKHASCSHD